MKVLSILNLSENKKLKALRLNLPSLKDLLISDSGIEEMDVKSLTMLNYLDISGNRIA
jgi:Leucine-rich repeat (LRR) protein